MLYFDHNATHPVSAAARSAWLEAVERQIGNPSSPHRVGARADAALTAAREQLAARLGCGAGEIVWTSGATEGNNAVLYHAARSTDGEAWISAIEHPSTIAAVQRYFPQRHRLIPVNGGGVVDLDWLADRLKQARPGIIAIMAANNETGVLQPWREAAALCREKGVPFFSDAAQWVGKRASAGLGECDYMEHGLRRAAGAAGLSPAVGGETGQAGGSRLDRLRLRHRPGRDIARPDRHGPRPRRSIPRPAFQQRLGND